MDYVVEARIVAPLDTVWAALADPAQWPAWQLGLAEVTGLQDPEPSPGAERALHFALPGWSEPLHETVLVVVPARRYAARYVGGGATHLSDTTLIPDGDGVRIVQQHVWDFDLVDASDDDRERFIATSAAALDALRVWVEQGRRVPPAAEFRT